MKAAAPQRAQRIGRRSAGMLMTTKEFDAIRNYDERYRYELINGVLVVSPIPLESQSNPNEELGFLLRSYQYGHPEGSCIDETLAERYIRTKNRRLADRVIWIGLGRVPDPEVDTPTVAVEFVSSGKRNRERDYTEKRREYMAAGVQQYWLFDRFRRILTVYQKKAGRITSQVIHEGEIFRTPLLPGFELDLARILAAADRWAGVKAKKKRP
jgi:Uma2 family endonuclease